MKHKLTQQDVDKMKAEIEHRKVEVRPELLEHVKEARAHGDLSENFEYHAAKKEKNRNESRIRYLERMIRTCEIVEDHSDADQVGLNKTVTLYFEEDDETDKFSFVTTVLVDTMQNRVSIESPLGKALLGHKKGERVYIPVNPQYGYYVEIKEIELFNERHTFESILICKFGTDEKRKNALSQMRLGSVFKMRVSILNTATTEQMG